MRAKFICRFLMDRAQAEALWFEDIPSRVSIGGIFGGSDVYLSKRSYVFRDGKRPEEPLSLDCGGCSFRLRPDQDTCRNGDLVCPPFITKEEFRRIDLGKKACEVLTKEKLKDLLGVIRTRAVSCETKTVSRFFDDSEPARCLCPSTQRLQELEKAYDPLKWRLSSLQSDLSSLLEEERHIQSVLEKSRKPDPEKNGNPSD